MATGFPEIAIGLACDLSLRFGDRLDRDLSYLDELIKTAACNRVFAAINHRRGFHKADGRNTRLCGALSEG